MKPENKRKSIIAVKVAGFIMLFLGVLVALNFILSPSVDAVKRPYRTYDYNRIYAEKENSIDVAFVGNSQVYAGISPMNIYGEYGYAGYNLSIPLMGPSDIYESLRDLFKKQSPKLIVMEVIPFFYDSDGIVNLAQKRRIGLSVWPFIENHAYWKDGFKAPRSCAKGFVPKYSVRSFDKHDSLTPAEGTYTLRDGFEDYMAKIIQECKSHDAEILFLAMPGKNTWTYPMHNLIAGYADDNGYKMLDMNTGSAYEEVNIDWASDFADFSDHLNFDGAQKTTSYLGKYLSENYNLPIRKGTPEYADWDKDLEEFNAKAAKKEV